MPIIQDFEYTLPELNRRVESYFSGCDEKGQKYSDAGLCIALDLHISRLQVLSKLGDDYYAVNPALRADYRKEHGETFTQWKHLELLKRALLKIQDQLAGRTDTNAIFARKQPWLGGYTDKPAASDATVNVSVKLEGMGKTDAFG